MIYSTCIKNYNLYFNRSFQEGEPQIRKFHLKKCFTSWSNFTLSSKCTKVVDHNLHQYTRSEDRQFIQFHFLCQLRGTFYNIAHIANRTVLRYPSSTKQFWLTGMTENFQRNGVKCIFFSLKKSYQKVCSKYFNPSDKLFCLQFQLTDDQNSLHQLLHIEN